MKKKDHGNFSPPPSPILNVSTGVALYDLRRTWRVEQKVIGFYEQSSFLFTSFYWELMCL